MRTLSLAFLSLTLVATQFACGDKKEKVIVYENGGHHHHRHDDDDDYEIDDDDFEYDDDDYDDVVIEHRHVCTPSCYTHFYNGNRVVVLRGHRHGPGCGHDWNGRYYVRVAPRKRVVRARHVCTQACHHHFYNGSRVVTIQNHRHGPGCGHRWNGTYWIVGRAPAPRRVIRTAHVCTRDCHDHFYNGSRVITLSDHRHGPRCGHVWDGTYWIAGRGKTTVIDKRPRRR